MRIPFFSLFFCLAIAYGIAIKFDKATFDRHCVEVTNKVTAFIQGLPSFEQILKEFQTKK
jgi:hypothetical protein